MKSFIAMSLSILLAGWTQAQAQQPGEKEVAVGINSVYVPAGFDINSDVYVVTSGIFPNSCYRWNRAEVTSKTNHEHEIQTMAMVQSGMCLMFLMPFTKEVRLGKLQAGDHTLRFVSSDGTYLEKKLSVEE